MSIDELSTSERCAPSPAEDGLESASEDPPVGMRRLSSWLLRNSPHRVALIASNFVRDNPAWVTVILGLAALVAIVGAGLLIAAVLALIFLSLAKVPSTSAARVVTEPVWRYLGEHSSSLPVGSSALRITWIVFGAASLVWAVGGAKGARVGWALFGLLTAGMVWSATDMEGRWVAVGITAVWWSAFSVAAYRSTRGADAYESDEEQPRKPGRDYRRGAADSAQEFFGGISSEARGAALQRKMFSSINQAGHQTFGDFYRANCTRPLKGIALMLDVPVWLVRQMKYETFPPGDGWRMDRVPWQIQYDAATAHLLKGEKVSSIASRHGASTSAVRGWIRNHSAAVLADRAERTP